KLTRVVGAERMLAVDMRCHSSRTPRIGYDRQRECGLPARFRTVDLSNATSGDTADADRGVEVDRPGRNRLDPHLTLGAEPHDRSLAAAFFDLRNGQIQRFLLVVRDRGDSHRAHILSLVVNSSRSEEHTSELQSPYDI